METLETRCTQFVTEHPQLEIRPCRRNIEELEPWCCDINYGRNGIDQNVAQGFGNTCEEAVKAAIDDYDRRCIPTQSLGSDAPGATQSILENT